MVAELNDVETARALHEASGGNVVTVRAVDVVSRITAQACRQPGLSFVWRDLLDFAGDEIYFQRCARARGLERSGTPCWHTTPRASSAAGPPRARSRSTPTWTPSSVRGDSVIAISADDDTVVFTGFADEDAPDVVLSPPPADRPERLLVVGWSHIGPVVLRELDEFAPPESEVDVLVDPDLVDPGELVDLELKGCATTFQHDRWQPRRAQRRRSGARVRQGDHPRLPQRHLTGRGRRPHAAHAPHAPASTRRRCLGAPPENRH